MLLRFEIKWYICKREIYKKYRKIMKKIMMMAAMALFCIGVSAQCPDKKKKCDKPKTEQCCKKKKGDCCKKKCGEKKGEGCKKKCQSECGNKK